MADGPYWGPDACSACRGWGWVVDGYGNGLRCWRCAGSGRVGGRISRPAPDWVWARAQQAGGQVFKAGYPNGYRGARDPSVQPTSFRSIGRTILALVMLFAIAMGVIVVGAVYAAITGRTPEARQPTRVEYFAGRFTCAEGDVGARLEVAVPFPAVGARDSDALLRLYDTSDGTLEEIANLNYRVERLDSNLVSLSSTDQTSYPYVESLLVLYAEAADGDAPLDTIALEVRSQACDDTELRWVDH